MQAASGIKYPCAPQAIVLKPKFKVACVQLEAGANLQWNRKRALEMTDEAMRGHRASLVVLPETALSGYGPSHWPEGLDKLDLNYLKASLEQLQALARRRKSTVVVGTTEYRKSSGYYNSAIAIDERGRRVWTYDKLHLTGAWNNTLDSTYYRPGAKKGLRPIRLLGIPVGIQICLDMRYPESWRLLARLGARIFAHPTACLGREDAWKIEPVAANLSSRCSENGCWLASANLAGPFQFSRSCIVDPDGAVVTLAQRECEQVISAAIDPDFCGRSNFHKTPRNDVYSLELRSENERGEDA